MMAASCGSVLLLAAALQPAAAVPHAAAPAVVVLVADNTTMVPVAGGPFTFFSSPKCSGGSAFFVGSPDSGKGGIFNAALAGAAPVGEIGITVKTGPPAWADAMPGAPSGTTIFEVSDWAGGLDGMAFAAFPQAAEDQSLARVVLSVGGTLSSVADMSVAAPGGGTFTKFSTNTPGVGHAAATTTEVAFGGTTSTGEDGWWLASSSSTGAAAPTITKIVDNTTAMPIAGGFNFHGFDGGMAIASDSSSGAFFANNGLKMTNPDARTGIFSWSKATNKITCIANDNDTAVPGLTDDWRFTAFGGVSVSPSGSHCFMGEAADPTGNTPPHVGIWCKGATAANLIADAPLLSVVDSTMIIPGSPDGEKFQYVDYPSVSPDGSTVVFQGNDQGGRRGVYAVVIGSPVIKLFDWQDQITGQKVFNIQLNQGSFDGASVSMFVAFALGNEGIYSIPTAIAK